MHVQYHLLSFEGPDGYASAGGIASRVTGLAQALADAGFATHLWFVGDPDLPGHETRHQLQLHRWCQWLSRTDPAGVYDGEDAKHDEYAASLQPFLLREVLLPHLQQGGTAVILAEEWHTVHAVLHLDWLLRQATVRPQVTILWNANNTFAFDRIAWGRLAEAAMITTVSRYMKHLMHGYGVNAMVIPNGLSPDDLVPPTPAAVRAFSCCVPGRTVLSKVARWDPDKGWVQTIDTVSAMQRLGWRPLLLARGGIEAHGAEVLAKAVARGLRVVERTLPSPGVPGVLRLLERVHDVDIVSIRSALDPDSRRVLLHASDAVLANSRHAPFGLVGLETMAVGGLACIGCSGADYAVPGRNALVLETTDPHEFLVLFGELRANPALARAIRRAGRLTAQHYRWPEIVAHILLPRLRCVATRASADHGSPPEPLAPLEALGLEATSQRKWKGLPGSRDPPREAMQGFATCVVRSRDRRQQESLVEQTPAAISCRQGGAYRMHLRFAVTHRTLSSRRSTPMLRTLGKTVGSALAMLCLVATLAVAADEKAGMEMTCVKTDGKGNCVVGTMPDGKELVLVGSGLKEGETMLCHHRENMIHCVPVPAKK